MLLPQTIQPMHTFMLENTCSDAPSSWKWGNFGRPNCHFVFCTRKKQERVKLAVELAAWANLAAMPVQLEDGRGTREVANTANKLPRHHFCGLHANKKSLQNMPAEVTEVPHIS